jgi:hypothetical protein
MNALTLTTVPHLITANSHPLKVLEMHILKHQDNIKFWFLQQFRDIALPFYTRMNLRNYSNQFSIGDFTPCAVLLNEDLATAHEIREVN